MSNYTPQHRGEPEHPVVGNVREMQAEAATKADVTQRSKRTFLQGLAIDLALAVAAVLLLWLPDADLSSRDAWPVLGTSVAKSVLTAIASYVMRLKGEPEPAMITLARAAILLVGAVVLTLGIYTMFQPVGGR